MTECKTYDQKAIQATGNDSLIYFETTRSKMGKQELQVARSARFTPVLQIATNKQTNKQNKQTKKKHDMKQQTSKKKRRYESRKMVLNQVQAVKIKLGNGKNIFRVQGIAIN